LSHSLRGKQTMKKFLAASAVVLAIGLGTNAQAAVVAQWDFNAATDKLVASTGTGTAVNIGGTASSFASDTAGNGSSDPNAVGTGNGGGGWGLTTFPAQSTNSGTAGGRFNFDTSSFTSTNFSAITVGFDLRTSNTASRWYRLDYTTDNGDTWTLGSPVRLSPDLASAGDRWHNGNSVTLTDSALFSNADAGIRIVSVFSPDAFTQVSGNVSFGADSAYEVARNPAEGANSAYLPTGTWRFDMVTVTAVPEPSSLALLGLIGGVGVYRARRRLVKREVVADSVS